MLSKQYFSSCPIGKKLQQQLLWLLGLILLITLVFYTFSFVKWSQRVSDSDFYARILGDNYGYGYYPTEKSFLDTLASVPYSLLDAPDVPVLHLDIKFKHLLKLQQKREEALRKKILVKAADDFVPAKIRYEDKSIKVDIRLKGDLVDHLQDEKWSMRVKVKGKKQLFGMRKFSLQNPEVRGYHGENVYFDALQKVGVLTPRYFFVNVFINGNDIGLMAFEEAFSKEILESNKHREGVIIKLDESAVWLSRLQNNKEPTKEISRYYSEKILAFGSNKIKKSPKLMQDYEIAVGLFRAFQQGDLEASEVFDVKLLARYFAMAEVLGAWHGLVWHNQRFYLNPISLKLEPIAYDGSLHVELAAGKEVRQAVFWVRRALLDSVLFAEYSEVLKKLLYQISTGSLIADLSKKQQLPLSQLRQEKYLLSDFDYSRIIDRSKLIQPNFSLPDKEVNLGDAIDNLKYLRQLQGYRLNVSNQKYIELANLTSMSVNVTDIYWYEKTTNTRKSFSAKSLLTLPFTLKKTLEDSRLEFLRIPYDVSDDFEIKHTLVVESKFDQLTKVYKTEITKYFPVIKQHPIPNHDIQKTLDSFPFLKLEDNHLIVLKGNWTVDKPIVLPSSYDLKISAGTKLSFSKDSYLLTRAAILMSGSLDEPIVLEGIEGEEWQGLIVLEAKNRSVLNYVDILNTTNIDIKNWSLTGGVNFFRTQLYLNRVNFFGSVAEDALNIVSSQFEFNNLIFENIISDAIDSDFSEGTINDSAFKHVSGDAIDLSDSKLHISDILFEDITDKAISVGEQSSATVFNINASNVGIGVACKDKSKLLLSDATFSKVKNAALMAYIKKPVFGPAEIEANSIIIDDPKKLVLLEKGSSIKIDGEFVTPNLDMAIFK